MPPSLTGSNAICPSIKRFKFASQNLIDFDFVKFVTFLCMFVHVNACVCVCCLICSVLLLIEWQMFYAVPNWDVNRLRIAPSRERNCVRHALLFTLSLFPFVVAILISGCQYCYKFIGRIWVWLTSITKYQANTISSTSWKLFLFVSSSTFCCFSLIFFLYPVQACRMGAI